MNSVLELAEAFDAMTKQQGSGSVADYWATVFRCDSSSPDLFIAVAAMQAKLAKIIQVLAAAELSERSKGLYIQAASSLVPFVMGHQIAGMNKSQIVGQRQNIDVLFLAAEIYPQEAAPQINPLTLEALEKELSDLIKEIRQSEMPMQLRHSVETQLNTLLLAIRGYAVLGQEGFARLYGSAAVGLSQAAQAAPSPNSSSTSLVKKALGFCQKTGTAIVWASATLAGAHGVLESGTAIAGLIGLAGEAGGVPDGS